VHRGLALPDSLRRYLTCDGTLRPIHEVGGIPVSVGRTHRTVPDRTRVVVEDRDRGCRVPGCDRQRWLHIHHVVHWEDGGPTDTSNLVAICPRHHRLHHLGQLGVAGDADRPDGLVFTDQRGQPLAGSGPPVPPTGPLETTASDLGIRPAGWRHPTGERLDARWIILRDPPSKN
jgi:hypothetical protein